MDRKLSRFVIPMIALVMGFMLSLGLVGCGGDSGADANNNGSAPEASTPSQSTDGQAQQEAAEEVEIRIQAAASLTDAMDEIIEAYTAKSPHVTIIANYDSSGTLAEQILQGAPADIFISANQAKMDDVEAGDMVKDGTRVDYLENELVMIVPTGNPQGINSLEDLTTDKVTYIAVGEPQGVPVGKYTEQALETAGLLDELTSKMVQGKDVRAVLTYVETEDADAGFVYKTDAMISDKVEIQMTIDGHDLVIYPAALMKDSDAPEAAQEFFDYLMSSEGTSVLETYGFAAV